MNFRTGTNGLKARLKRVEDLAGKGRRNCPSCRLLLRRQWPDPTKPRARPEDFVGVICQFCHTESAIYLGNIPEEERDAWRAWYPISTEFWYLNRKANALGMWLERRPQLNQSAQDGHWQQHQQEWQHQAASRGAAKGQTPGQRLVTELWREKNDLLGRKLKMLWVAYGEMPFRKEQQELIESVRAKAEAERKERSHVKGLERFEKLRTEHLVCAELEKIIWGEVRPQTRKEIEGLELVIGYRVQMKEEEEAQTKETKKSEQREAEECANMRQGEERLRKIKSENKQRRWLKLELLPDDYQGSFTPYAQLIQMAQTTR